MLGRRSQPKRFSLVLLSQDEEYISDYICIYSRGGSKDLVCPGRIKICSQSIFIDPDDYEYPVYRFRFKDIESLEIVDIRAESRSQHVTSSLYSLLATGCSVALVVHAKSVTEMKHLGQDTPYATASLRGASIVTSVVMPYSDLASEFPIMRQLWELSMLPDYLLQLENLLSKRSKELSFDTTSLNSIKEKQLLESALSCMVVGPLQQSRSLVMVTDTHIYVQPLVQDASQSRCSKFTVSYSLRALSSIMKRRHHLRHVAIEVFVQESQSFSVFMSFGSTEERDLVYNLILTQANISQPSLAEVVHSWVTGAMSNFDYIMSLNRFAGRSYMDFTAYHIFPWILSDYCSQELNLSNPNMFRDLSKPIGALNPERLQKFRDRYNEMPRDEPKFLYGTHYSAPGYVVYYLVRSHPEYMLALQSGRFDAPDRLFCSINETWLSCNNNQADVKELIPEFYDVDRNPDFLKDCQSFLGHRADGTAIGKVVLPPWADNDPVKFIAKMREALDSPYVSERLHQWIDLIFGYKQRGEEAEAAENVFFHLTYEGAVDFDKIQNRDQQRSLLAQIQEFGQTPSQLFTTPHPRWNPIKTSVNFPSLSSIPCNLPGSPNANYVNVQISGSVLDQDCLRYLSNIKDGISVWNLNSFSFHSDRVTSVVFDPDEQHLLVSISKDGSLKAYSAADKRLVRACYPGTPGLALSCLCSATIVKPSNILRFYVCGSADSKLHIYCSNAGQVIQTLPFAHDDTPVDCQWSPTYQRLASCALDATVKIWDFSSNGIAPVPLRSYAEHDAPVSSLDWYGSYLATASASGNLAIWDPRMSSSSRFFYNIHEGPITDLCWSSESQLITCSIDSSLQITDIRSGKCLINNRLPSGLSCLKSIGPISAVGSVDGRIFLCDNSTLTYRQALRTEPTTSIDTLDVSEDCSKICCSAETVHVWTQQIDPNI